MEEFLPIEIEFLAEADTLPEEYIPYFAPPLDTGIHIPGKKTKVGDIKIQIFQNFIVIQIGDHTEFRFSRAQDAVRYLSNVLRNEIVFYFGERGVEYFQATDFDNLSETDWNYYVWSGPFRYEFLNG